MCVGRFYLELTVRYNTVVLEAVIVDVPGRQPSARHNNAR